MNNLTVGDMRENRHFMKEWIRTMQSMREIKYYIPTSFRHTVLSNNLVRIIVGLLLILLGFLIRS